MGSAQGGAQAAVFDVLCALCASLASGSACPTGQLAVRYRRPVHPVPGVYRAEAWVHEEAGRKVTVRAKLTRGGTQPDRELLSTAEATMIIPRSKL